MPCKPCSVPASDGNFPRTLCKLSGPVACWRTLSRGLWLVTCVSMMRVLSFAGIRYGVSGRGEAWKLRRREHVPRMRYVDGIKLADEGVRGALSCW